LPTKLLYGLLLTSYCVLFQQAKCFAQTIPSVSDSLVYQDTAKPITGNSGKTSESFLSENVNYSAKDSMITNLIDQKVYLYGDAKIDYDGIKLSADYITIDMSNKQLFASGLPDSTGTIVGKPIFEEGGKTYNSETISYNFDSKKGKISTVITEEGGGYVHGETVKKANDSTFYIENGAFTTCDLEHPHFYIGSSKLKIVPGDKIITGPAFLVLQDIPTPLIVPFGYFPTNSKQKSGVILPAPGSSNSKGYFLREGGYYFAISDRVDLRLIGEVFSRGSWGLSSITRYNTRYKRNGQLQLSYNYNKTSEPEFPDYSLKKDIFIRWNHRQDAKAKPNSNFSASVNAGSSSFLKNTSTVSNDIIKSDLISSISYSKVFPGTPFTMNVSANHNQKLSDGTITLKVPQLGLNMSRLYPFKRKNGVGKQKWFEKVGVNYNMEVLNQISTYDSLLFTPQALDQFRNGMRHRASASSSVKVLKFLSLTPSFNYAENWYLNRIEKDWDSNEKMVITDTINDFSTNRSFSMGANLTTRIYGMKSFRFKRLKAIRHVISPSIGFRYRPDFGDDRWGFYDNVQTDSTGTVSQYSLFENGIYGNAPIGKQGNITYNIGNILELKVRQRQDSTTTTKKVKLIESLNVSGSYNFAAEQFNWSQVNLTARTSLYKNLGLKLNGRLDPYSLDSNGTRVNILQYDINQKLGRFTDAGISVNWSISDGKKKNDKSKSNVTKTLTGSSSVDFSLPWSLNLYYTYAYNKPGLESNTTQSLNFNGDIRLTPKWKIGFNSGYDFKNKDLSFTRVNINRDLHCWELAFDWIPFGFRQSYTLTLRVKSPVLKDLKIDRKRNWFDF
jgi:lipopolysaccharide assembly outer membrane protein LptD (OstA)